MPIRVVKVQPKRPSRRKNLTTDSEVGRLLTVLRDDPFGLVDSFQRVPGGYMVEIELDDKYQTFGILHSGAAMDALSEAVFCHTIPRYYDIDYAAGNPLDVLRDVATAVERHVRQEAAEMGVYQ